VNNVDDMLPLYHITSNLTIVGVSFAIYIKTVLLKRKWKADNGNGCINIRVPKVTVNDTTLCPSWGKHNVSVLPLFSRYSTTSPTLNN